MVLDGIYWAGFYGKILPWQTNSIFIIVIPLYSSVNFGKLNWRGYVCMGQLYILAMRRSTSLLLTGFGEQGLFRDSANLFAGKYIVPLNVAALWLQKSPGS